MQLYLGREAADQTNVFNRLLCPAVLPDQLRAAPGMDRGLLPDVLAQIDGSGREVLIKYNFPELKFLYFYEHRNLPRAGDWRAGYRNQDKRQCTGVSNSSAVVWIKQSCEFGVNHVRENEMAVFSSS
jgi:hypothetical protein